MGTYFIMSIYGVFMSRWEIRTISPDEIRSLICDELGFPDYQVEHLYRYLYVNGVGDFDEMRYLPKSVREELNERYYITPPEVGNRLISEDDETTKYLIRYEDGAGVEMVYLPHRDWNSLCISTQVGCRRGCRFCATGMMGFKRDLYWGEIVDQVRLASDLMGDIRNLVLMGMGEPLDNYDEVVRAIRFLLDVYGFGRKRVTLSTIGDEDGLSRLREEGLGIRLALSLNSYDEDKRRELMPGTEGSIKKKLELLARYGEMNDDMETIEYVLLGGVNDSVEDAKGFLELIKEYRFKVNLIRYNSIGNTEYISPEEEDVINFLNIMREYDSPVMLRDSKGYDINASCGQLAVE